MEKNCGLMSGSTLVIKRDALNSKDEVEPRHLLVQKHILSQAEKARLKKGN
jgi:hypothetical protein